MFIILYFGKNLMVDTKKFRYKSQLIYLVHKCKLYKKQLDNAKNVIFPLVLDCERSKHNRCGEDFWLQSRRYVNSGENLECWK